MPEIEHEPSVENLLLRNDQVVEPPEEIKEPEPPEAEITDPPVPVPEPEKVDKVVEEAKEDPPEGDDPDGGDGEDGEEYTQAEWDALPKDKQDEINAEYEASLQTAEEAETERVARQQEVSDKLKQDRLDFEKNKLDWEQKQAESKKEAEKDYQRKMNMVAEEAREAGVADRFKERKAQERQKPPESAEPLFPKYAPKQLVTQEEARRNKWNQAQVNNANEQRNATAKTNYDKMADHFNSQTEFVNEIKAERAQKSAFEKRAGEWGKSITGLAEELGYEIFTAEGRYTPEANQIYEELGKVGVLEQDETTTEYRANMVRLIRSSVNGSPASKPNGQQLSVRKLSKAPPGQTLKTSSQKIPRRKRPPNTMGGRGTGSHKVQQELKNVEQIILNNE